MYTAKERPAAILAIGRFYFVYPALEDKKWTHTLTLASISILLTISALWWCSLAT